MLNNKQQCLDDWRDVARAQLKTLMFGFVLTYYLVGHGMAVLLNDEKGLTELQILIGVCTALAAQSIYGARLAHELVSNARQQTKPAL